MREKRSILFAAVIGVFSVLALVLALLTNAAVTEKSDECTKLSAQLTELKKDNEYLRAKIESTLSPEKLEVLARSLGMQPLSPEQTEVLELPEGQPGK